MEYKKRIADGMLRDKLDAMGAILIEGPKACGKAVCLFRWHEKLHKIRTVSCFPLAHTNASRGCGESLHTAAERV